MEQFLSKLLLGAALALGISSGGIAEGADLGRRGAGRDLGLSRGMGKGEGGRGQDIRGREIGRLELDRRSREAQRDVRRKREERRIERSGTLQDLERYQRKERSKDATSDLSYDLDRELIESRAESDSSTAPDTRVLDLERDIERSLDNVEFERRQRRLEHELQGRDKSRRTHGTSR